jgi:cobalt-zinc-cadmium efflux system protein
MNATRPATLGPTPLGHAELVARAAPSRRLLVALVLALGVLGLEVGGGLITGSLALLSDAAHVLVDIVALLVGLGASHLAAREPDAGHTYGFHRLEAIGALANAVLLIAASAVVLAESIGRLLAPSAVDAPVVLLVASVGFVVNSASALIVHGSGRRTEATSVLVLHLGGDAAGALAVIASALVIMAGGSPAADPAASLVIAILLGLAGLRLLGRIVHLLSEGVPTAVSLDAASAALHAIPGVQAVHDLHVWAIAEDLPVVTAHLETSFGADTRRVLLTTTEALHRIGVGHATLQLEYEPCGQGRPAVIGVRPSGGGGSDAARSQPGHEERSDD